jgi:hypothetical protein
MGRACSVREGRLEIRIQIWFESLKVRVHSEDLGVDGV